MNMKRYDVMCLGLATVDIIAGILEPEALMRDTTYLETLSMQIGGDAVNQATVLSRLGCKTGLVALCGNDFWGTYLIDSLRKEGVDCSKISVDGNIPTTVSIVMLDAGKERHFACRKGGMDYFNETHVDLTAIREAKIVSLASNLALKSLDGPPTCELFAYARKHGAVTAADYSIGKDDENVDKSMVSEMLKHTDYIMPSYSEASIITGESEVERIIEAFLDFGATNIILKLGDKGCYVHTKDISEQINSYAAKVVDTTGAGDCFAAGFLFGMSEGRDIKSCAKLACAAGAIGVESVGANVGLRTKEQLLQRAKI